MHAAEFLSYILALAAENLMDGSIHDIFFVGNQMDVSAKEAAAALTLQCPTTITIRPCKDGALLVYKTNVEEKYREVIAQVCE